MKKRSLLSLLGLFAIATIACFCFQAGPALASNAWNAGWGEVVGHGLPHETTPVQAATNIQSWLFDIALVIAIIAFVASGIIWIVSAGNPDLAKKAQKWVAYSIIGLVVIFLAESVYENIVQPVLTTGESSFFDVFLNNVWTWLSFLILVLSIIAFTAAGVIWVASAGNPAMNEKAQKWVMYSIIGLVVSFLGNVISNTIQDLTGGLSGLLAFSHIGLVLLNVFVWLTLVVVVLGAISIVASGVILIISTGHPVMAARAYRWLTYSIIGLVVAFSSLAILVTLVDLFELTSIIGISITTILGLFGISLPFTINAILDSFLQWLTALLSVVMAISLVTSGVLMITTGDSSIATRARKWVMYSIIGLSISLLAYVIIVTIDAVISG